MNKFPMLREILKDMEMKDNVMRLYRPYFQVSVVPEKKTFSGEHKEKLMFSFGLRYDDERANAFFSSDDPLKGEILERMSKQLNITQENIMKSFHTGKLKDLLISAVEIQLKHLGIPLIVFKKTASFEIYSYVKSSDPNEILEMIQSMLIALGRSVKIFSESEQEKNLIYYEMNLKTSLEKFLRRGFDGTG